MFIGFSSGETVWANFSFFRRSSSSLTLAARFSSVISFSPFKKSILFDIVSEFECCLFFYFTRRANRGVKRILFLPEVFEQPVQKPLLLLIRELHHIQK